MALLDGRPLDERTVAERRMGGRVMDWDTVALLDGTQRTLVMLDGRERAGLGYGGVAGRKTSG